MKKKEKKKFKDCIWFTSWFSHYIVSHSLCVIRNSYWIIKSWFILQIAAHELVVWFDSVAWLMPMMKNKGRGELDSRLDSIFFYFSLFNRIIITKRFHLIRVRKFGKSINEIPKEFAACRPNLEARGNQPWSNFFSLINSR